MPSCRPDVIPSILYKLIEMRPKTILEVGIGFGKWGVLCKEYLKFWTNHEPVIDGIEVFKDYESVAYKAYRTVHFGDAVEVTKNLDLSQYDLLLMIDVIEHMSKSDGDELLKKANNYLVSTPAYWSGQGALFGNEHERHVSRWGFQDFVHSKIVTGENSELKFVLGWKK